MGNKLFKFSLVCVTGAVLLGTNPKSALAMEEAVAGFVHDKSTASTVQTGSDVMTISTFSSDEIPVPGFNNIGIANVEEDNLNIRKGPGTNEKIVGKLPKDGGCDILEADTGSGWTKIKSNGITGYVKTEYLITGEKASQLAAKIATPVAISETDGLRVREKPSVNSAEIDTIAKGEELLVLDALVLNYGEENDKWVKVSLDSDSREGIVGYVSKTYVTLAYTLPKASSMEELQYDSGVSSLRANLVNKAKDYLGGRYVWGGTKLGQGVDCSGFTQQIYAKFYYYIPRTSGSQGSSGTKISRSELKVGDLVFYGNSSGINHVAIYIGNDRIIHASNKRDGIKISNMYYRNPYRYVRYIKD